MSLLRYLVVFVLALVPAAALAQSGDDFIERVAAVCNGDDAGSAACLKRCQALQEAFGESAFDRLPNFLAKNCKFAITNAESSQLTKGKACGKSVCIYRLARKGKNGFAGSGYSLSFKRGGAGQVVSLRDAKGRVTSFEQCMTCGWDALDYVKGPLKRARFADGSEGSIILTLPR